MIANKHHEDQDAASQVPRGIVWSDGDTKFSDETMESLRELGAVLRPIHERLIAEGYTIKNGKMCKGDVL